MPTSFRDPFLRRVYDTCVAAYRAKGALYLREGNSAAVMFRRGFTGSSTYRWDAASRNTLAYASFCAGRDCAKEAACSG
jgi:hypothetical protein